MLPKVVAGVVALSKVAHASKCGDEKQWSVCIDAYRNGECHAIEGCKRTCGKCVDEKDCYDKIPENHSFLWNQGFAALSMYPNSQNTDQNIFPRSLTNTPEDDKEKVEGFFPFEKSSVSKFCLDVFTQGRCNDHGDLQLTYEDYGPLPLYGMASEYCAFTCGVCKVSEENPDPENPPCWAIHNSNMDYLSSLGKPVDHGLMLNFGHLTSDLDTMFPTEPETIETIGAIDYRGWESEWDTEWDTPAVEEETDAGWGTNDDWSNSWDAGWGRKRRGASTSAMQKSELLTEAIESMIFPAFKDDLPLNSRSRRQAWQMIGQQPTDHDQTEKIKNEMYDLKCFKSDLMNTEGLDGEEPVEEIECEGEGCEEETEDPVVRVRQQRHETDHEGMGKWVKSNAPDGTVLDGTCQAIDIMGTREAFSEMQLAYACQIKCEVGVAHVEHNHALVSLADGIQMECRKRD